jgi:hypothetical protein
LFFFSNQKDSITHGGEPWDVLEAVEKLSTKSWH